jgi:hypothetical protein
LKAHALYYAGDLVGIITHPENHSDIHKIAEMLSPDEGLTSWRDVEISDELLKNVTQENLDLHGWTFQPVVDDEIQEEEEVECPITFLKERTDWTDEGIREELVTAYGSGTSVDVPDNEAGPGGFLEPPQEEAV